MMIPSSLKIFLVGILESFFYSFNTKTIQKNMEFLSFIVSIISVFLWYYVIVMVVENVNNFWLILAYGCANGLGDILTIRFDVYIDKIEERVLGFFSSFRLRWPIEFKGKNKRRLNKVKPTKKRGIKCRKLSA